MHLSVGRQKEGKEEGENTCSTSTVHDEECPTGRSSCVYVSGPENECQIGVPRCAFVSWQAGRDKRRR